MWWAVFLLSFSRLFVFQQFDCGVSTHESLCVMFWIHWASWSADECSLSYFGNLQSLFLQCLFLPAFLSLLLLGLLWHIHQYAWIHTGFWDSVFHHSFHTLFFRLNNIYLYIIRSTNYFFPNTAMSPLHQFFILAILLLNSTNFFFFCSFNFLLWVSTYGVTVIILCLNF